LYIIYLKIEKFLIHLYTNKFEDYTKHHNLKQDKSIKEIPYVKGGIPFVGHGLKLMDFSEFMNDCKKNMAISLK
jgi:hypothetical protein